MVNEKVLFRKERSKVIEDTGKEIVISNQRSFFVKDISNDFSTDEGFISKKDLKKKDGSVVKTNIGKEFNIFTASFPDKLRKIGRLAQIITPKDVGLIIAETGINKTSKIVDAGAGSGALACSLANIAKSVTTYDIRDDCLKIVRDNKKFLKLNNLKIKKGDIYRNIEERDVDVITLDVPEPWHALDNVCKALKPGGFLVTYLPTVLQISDLVKSAGMIDELAHIKTVELIERQWKIKGRAVRPTTKGIWHTAFLSFFRRI